MRQGVTGSDSDPELGAVIAAWPTLSGAVRAGIAALVTGVRTDSAGGG